MFNVRTTVITVHNTVYNHIAHNFNLLADVSQNKFCDLPK